jgi:hypothetical protein
MDRMIQANVIATSGRAVEAAGDVSTAGCARPAWGGEEGPQVHIRDRHTVEVWYALPNRGAIESWNIWLPG